MIQKIYSYNQNQLIIEPEEEFLADLHKQSSPKVQSDTAYFDTDLNKEVFTNQHCHGSKYYFNSHGNKRLVQDKHQKIYDNGYIDFCIM